MDKELFFKKIGFTDYESKALSSLLKLKKANVKEISLDSSVPQNKLYSIIKKFDNLGILASIPLEYKTYKIINFKTFVSKKIDEKENELESLRKDLPELDNIKDNEEFSFSLIKGQQTIMNKIAEHNYKVTKEILGVQRNWKIWGEGLRAMNSVLSKGVKVKLIGVINDKTKDKALEWKNLGCSVRIYNEKYGLYPLRFTIFDNQEARITFGKPEIQEPKNYITIWTKSKPLISMLRAQFMHMWKNSKPF